MSKDDISLLNPYLINHKLSKENKAWLLDKLYKCILDEKFEHQIVPNCKSIPPQFSIPLGHILFIIMNIYDVKKNTTISFEQPYTLDF